jgi:putative membrane protein
MLMRLVWHWFVLAFGLYLLTLIPPLGITFDSYGDLAWAAALLIVFNTILKPILIFFTLPLVLLTLGLFLLIINALILEALPHFVHGFHVPGFTSAFFGALLLSIITGLFSGWEKKRRPARRAVSRKSSGEVIDI